MKKIDRRTFVGVAAALASAETRAAEVPVRVGIIGAGSRGSSLLRPLLDLPGIGSRGDLRSRRQCGSEGAQHLCGRREA